MNRSLRLSPSTLTRSMMTVGIITTLGIAGLSACTPETADSPTDETEVVAPGLDETEVAAVEETDLSSQIGESFYFHSQFENQFSDALFVVQEDDGRGWGSVLVINRSDRAFAVPTDAETPLWIFGTVETLMSEELQNNEVPEAEWETYEGQPVIAAERITLVPSPSDLVANVDSFLNQDVTVYGKVVPVEAEGTFVLEDPELFGGKGVILVQGADVDLSTVVGEDTAVVSGVLRPYVIADLENEYGLTWNLELQEELAADYEESPVIVVEQALAVDN